MKIPLVDLQASLKTIKNDVFKRIENVVENTAFILGEEVVEFERSFASFVGAKYAVGVASGTDALHLAMRAAGIGPGDEVLVPANTFIATALGVTLAGARVVPVDVDERTFLMDVEKVSEHITGRTKAIIPVHLYGRMLDVGPLLEIAKKGGLAVIEDAAQAHGAAHEDRSAGTAGLLGCFSFYPGKNLGAYGDGGLVTTNDDELARKLVALRNYGSPKKYHHPTFGMNSRLDSIQAAVLNVKLPYLKEANEARHALAERYGLLLEGIGDIIVPEVPKREEHVFHLYVVRTKQRDKLLAYLSGRGIGAGIHYPTPIHMHGVYEDLGYGEGDFPVAERLCSEVLSLPLYPEMTHEQQDLVARCVREFFAQ